MSENKTLRALRQTKGYSQEYVASELGINQNTYSKIESGQTKLTVERVKKLAELYNVDAGELLSEDAKVINYNTGKYSHGGPIHTYNSCDLDLIKGLYEQIIKDKDSTIKTLESELATSHVEIGKLTKIIYKLSGKALSSQK